MPNGFKYPVCVTVERDAITGGLRVPDVWVYRTDAYDFTVSGEPQSINGEQLPATLNTFSTLAHDPIRKRAKLRFNQAHVNAWHDTFHKCISFQIPMTVNANPEPLTPVNSMCIASHLVAAAQFLVGEAYAATVRVERFLLRIQRYLSSLAEPQPRPNAGPGDPPSKDPPSKDPPSPNASGYVTPGSTTKKPSNEHVHPE